MDKYIIGNDDCGKTRKMLEEAKKSGATVVCKHPIHMQNKANAYGLPNLQFMSYDEFNDGSVDAEKVAIDEIGDFIAYIYGAKLDSFCFTGCYEHRRFGRSTGPTAFREKARM